MEPVRLMEPAKQAKIELMKLAATEQVEQTEMEPTE